MGTLTLRRGHEFASPLATRHDIQPSTLECSQTGGEVCSLCCAGSVRGLTGLRDTAP